MLHGKLERDTRVKRHSHLGLGEYGYSNLDLFNLFNTEQKAPALIFFIMLSKIETTPKDEKKNENKQTVAGK